MNSGTQSTRYPLHATRRSGGFSLIEVLVAIVVLATGLLALASLQASLTRSAADARARSQVAAFVDLVIERQRAVGSTNFKAVPSTTAWTAAELTAIQNSAGVSNLAVNVTSTYFSFNSATNAFTACDATCAAALSPKQPQYKELRTVATWTDATGASRRFDMTSVISPRTITDSPTPLSTPTSGSSASKQPVVRTPVPSDAGIIPIAIGGGSESAATNPKPKLSGTSVVRTSFEVLTYKNETSSAVQQRRVETAVIGCKCAAGTAFSSTNAQFATAQWPAYWNGQRYSIYKPEGNTAAPGSTAGRATATGVAQDELCRECCRDHHDSSSPGVVRFDPYSFATENAAHAHFKRNADGTFSAVGSGDVYEESCRMIRVDGFWRTAVDLNSEYSNFLATANSASGFVPDSTAQTNYRNMITGYLNSQFTNGAPATYNTPLGSSTVASLETSNQINAPTSITINRTGDQKWLHNRGLYVDYLEPDAIQAITSAKAKSECAGTAASACVLPLVPFTTINLTELSLYTSASTVQVGVENNAFSASTLAASGSQQPVRGRVFSGSNPTAATDVAVTGVIKKSNSGLAVVAPISSNDSTLLSDAQTFRIAGAAAPDGTGGKFFVSLAAPYTYTSALGNLPLMKGSNQGGDIPCDPDAGAGGAGVIAPPGINPYTCTANSLGSSTSVTVSRFNYASGATVAYSGTFTCSRKQGNDTLSTTCPLSGTNRPQCLNWRVSSVTSSNAAASPSLVSNLGAGASESFTYSIGTVAPDDVITFNFEAEASTVRDAYTCTAAGNGNTAECPTGTNRVTWLDPCGN